MKLKMNYRYSKYNYSLYKTSLKNFSISRIYSSMTSFLKPKNLKLSKAYPSFKDLQVGDINLNTSKLIFNNKQNLVNFLIIYSFYRY